MAKTERCHRQHRDAGFADQERVLVGAVERAPVLEDSQPTDRGLLGDAVVEHDDTVRHVFLDAMARQRPSPRSPVMTAVTPRSLRKRTGRANSDRRIDVFANAPNSVLDRVDHHSLRSNRVDRRTETKKQAVEIPVARLLHVAVHQRHVVEHQRPSASSWARSNPSDATFDRRSSMVSSNATNTPGSSNSGIPRTRNSIAISVLPHPAGPQTSVGRPRGRPPPVTSSSPLMPVGVLSRFGNGGGRLGRQPEAAAASVVWLLDTRARFRWG